MLTFDANKLPCPFCGAKEPQWKHHAFYDRYIIEFTNSKVIVNTVTITRLRCDSCNSTHALIPDFLIPYSSYSLTFILAVLNQFFSKTQTVKSLCSYFQISHSTLYNWVNLFRIHKKLWLGVLEDMISEPIDFLNTLLEQDSHLLTNNFLTNFFDCFAFSFLQGISRTADFNSS
jgi:transposase-like protein